MPAGMSLAETVVCFLVQQESATAFLEPGRLLTEQQLAVSVAPVVRHDSIEARAGGSGAFREPAVLFMDEPDRGRQQDSCPRAMRARQMQPRASSLSAYVLRVLRECSAHAFPSRGQ